MEKSNLEVFYKSNIVDLLYKEMNYKNIMQVPKLQKIVINMGLGDAKDNKNGLKQAVEEMTAITGQKPVITKSKKAISNFKIRESKFVQAFLFSKGKASRVREV